MYEERGTTWGQRGAFSRLQEETRGPSSCRTPGPETWQAAADGPAEVGLMFCNFRPRANLYSMLRGEISTRATREGEGGGGICCI